MPHNRLFYRFKNTDFMHYQCQKYLLFLFFTPLSISAQKASDSLQTIDLQQLTVIATMATDRTPMPVTNLSTEHIRRRDFGQDMPFLLKNTPSVVETSDAGAGIGYTGIRIRGSDATRTNVTIDGIPLNDAESQAVYWVDLPDLAASTSAIQIQRGVGTSTNGSGAFGATINVVTNMNFRKYVNPIDTHDTTYNATIPRYKPLKYMNYTAGIGSFGTFRQAIAAGTTLMNDKLTVDMRLSSIKSAGYVDRAAADLQSFYLSTMYAARKTVVKFKLMSGKEKTHQSWYGIPFAYINSSLLRTYNAAGTEKAGNPYEKQTDNYQQTHAHLAWNEQVSNKWRTNISIHYTKGKGYYEEYKAAQKPSNYDLTILTKPSTEPTTDLIRQLWLDNDFYGAIGSATYTHKDVEWVTGGGWNRYEGQHFGKVVWIEKNDIIKNLKSKFYESQSFKYEYNLYSKIIAPIIGNLTGFADMQFRHIDYTTQGLDRRKRDISRHVMYNFFNPKMGLSYQYGNFTPQNRGITEGGKVYASYAVANREPNRSDLTDAETGYLPRSERLFDTEIGWQGVFKDATMGVNFYQMNYKNQLAVTGAINDIGEQIRVNVPKSYRKGVEIEGIFNISKSLIINGNASFSENKILDFTENRDNWDTGLQERLLYGKTDLAYSPNVVLNAGLTYTIVKNDKTEWTMTPSVKYVGKQYLDNTSNQNTSLNAFAYADFNIYYKIKFKKYIKSIMCKLLINNILDKKYVNNGWTYRFISTTYDPRSNDPYASAEGNGVYNLSGFFPQAGRHFLLSFLVDL